MARMIDLIQRTITRLSMVAGPAVQLYAEDRIAEMIYHKFLVVRDEQWWEDFMTEVLLTIGLDGRPVDNVVRTLPIVPIGDEIVINSHRDIEHVWAENRNRPLPRLPSRSNRWEISTTGSPRYWSGDPLKTLRVYPYGDGARLINVRYKVYFPMFAPEDEVPMDDQLLILGACYDYLEDDGSNPSQIEKFRTLFQQRLSRMRSNENAGDVSLSHYNEVV